MAYPLTFERNQEVTPLKIIVQDKRRKPILISFPRKIAEASLAGRENKEYHK